MLLVLVRRSLVDWYYPQGRQAAQNQ